MTLQGLRPQWGQGWQCPHRSVLTPAPSLTHLEAGKLGRNVWFPLCTRRHPAPSSPADTQTDDRGPWHPSQPFHSPAQGSGSVTPGPAHLRQTGW